MREARDGELEPSLEGRFRDGCFIPTKAMSNRASCCRSCMRGIAQAGGTIRLQQRSQSCR